MTFVKFMASMSGRIIRIGAGVALIALGLLVVKDVGGLALGVVGLVPLMAGVLDVCLVAPLIGAPFSGEAIRKAR